MPEGLVPGTVRLVRAAWRSAHRNRSGRPAAAPIAEPKP